MLSTVKSVFRRSPFGVVESASGRLLRAISPRAAGRYLTSSSARHARSGRDVLARYAPPARRLDDSSPANEGLPDGLPSYVTMATSPAGPSLQDVPPPGLQPSTRKAIPVPAEKPTTGSSNSKSGPEPAKETYIKGVLVPPKPKPPGEEECCMSGCVHCVYTIYADELEEYTSALKSARDALVKAGTPAKDWPDAVKQVDEQGAEGMARAEEKKVESAVDPSLAAFLALESRLNKK